MHNGLLHTGNCICVFLCTLYMHCAVYESYIGCYTDLREASFIRTAARPDSVSLGCKHYLYARCQPPSHREQHGYGRDTVDAFACRLR